MILVPGVVKVLYVIFVNALPTTGAAPTHQGVTYSANHSLVG